MAGQFHLARFVSEETTRLLPVPWRSAVAKRCYERESLLQISTAADYDAEASLLGTMLMGRDAIAKGIAILGHGGYRWFQVPAHQCLYDVILDVFDDPAKQVDLVVISDELRRRGLLESVGGPEYLITLAESFSVAEHAEHYARSVRAASWRRREEGSDDELFEARRAAALADVQLAIELANESDRSLDSSCSSQLLGPLWPQGAPPGSLYRDDGSRHTELVCEIDVPDSVPDDDVYTSVLQLVDTLDSLDRAYGGHGLKIRKLEVHEHGPVPAGVPS